MLRNVIFTIALALSFFAADQANAATARDNSCSSGNRSYYCGGGTGTPSGGPVTICVETVVNGVVQDRRNVTFIDTGAWVRQKNGSTSALTYRECGTTPSCTTTTQTRTTTPCPVGQTGVITEQRTRNIPNGSGIPQCGVDGQWTEISRTCTVPPLSNCVTPWGAVVLNGQSVIAWQASSVTFGGTCVFETRVCNNGVLSGSFQFQNCTITTNNCTLPWGGTLAHGQSVTAYRLNNSVCESETRTCTNGVLSGSYTAQTCTAPRCPLPWGGTIAIGQSVTAYQAQFAATCVSETRTCNAGPNNTAVLSGTYTFQACAPIDNFCVTPWGATVGHGASVTAYSTATVAYGQICVSQVRVCNNGVLSGSYTFQNCAVEPPPANCVIPWGGGTIAHGQSVIAYQSSTVVYGASCNYQVRVCNNGVLSGSYMFGSCIPDGPANCQTPWGTTVIHGQSVIAYNTAQVAYGQVCVSENRLCQNGALTGTFQYQNCTVTTQNCSLPWGGTLAHGGSVTAYRLNGNVCESETRTCTNGNLSGSYTAQTCVVPPQNCTLPWGGTLLNGQSVTAYQTQNGNVCVSETRTCTNGVLSGSYAFQSCTVTNQNCSLPWGGTLLNGQSVVAYRQTYVVGGQCEQEFRTCTNGVLSGSFTAQNCVANNAQVLLLAVNAPGGPQPYPYCTDYYASMGLEYNPQLPYLVDIMLITGGQDGRLGKNCTHTEQTGRLRIGAINMSGFIPVGDEFNISATFRAKMTGGNCGYTGAAADAQGYVTRTVTLHVKKDQYSTSYIDHVIGNDGTPVTGPAAATAVLTEIPCIPYADFTGLAANGLFGRCQDSGAQYPGYIIYGVGNASFS